MLPWALNSKAAHFASDSDKDAGSKSDLLACMNFLKHCGNGAAKFAKSELPGLKSFLRKRPIKVGNLGKVKSCAVVGNAGHMLKKKYGAFIDKHDLVVSTSKMRAPCLNVATHLRSLIRPQNFLWNKTARLVTFGAVVGPVPLEKSYIYAMIE